MQPKWPLKIYSFSLSSFKYLQNCLYSTSIYSRDNPPPYSLHVLVPVSSVFDSAPLVIPPLAVDEQEHKVNHIEIRYDRPEQAGEAPSQGHADVPEEIEMPRPSPETRDKEQVPLLGLDILGL